MSLQERMNEAIKRDNFKQKMSDGKSVQEGLNRLQKKVQPRLDYLRNTEWVGPDYRR